MTFPELHPAEVRPSPTTFPILDRAEPSNRALPPFLVSRERGFLPRMDPPTSLPPEFAVVDDLLARMPVLTLDGKTGLLGSGGGAFGKAVRSELRDLTDEIERYKDDLVIVTALYRDYCFLASAYLLEPCHERFLRGEEYGLARQVLPRQIARPIARCAEICKFKPFMEYAGSYALYNYRLVDPSLGLESPDNVRLIRAFERGLDPASSEAGFVLVHVDMARHSGKLVDGVTRCFGAFDIVHARRHDDDSSKGQSGAMAKLRNRAELRDGLAAIVAGLRDVDTAMETMWARSRPSNYAAFRTFIFGITAQSMFPDGVLYEGLDGGVDVREEEEEVEETVEGAAVPKRVAVQRTGKKLSFRGESGANDSMIPMLDNLLQITMPDTPLTRILADFRDYRPSNHRAYLAFVASQSVALDLRSVALGLDTCSAVTTKQPGDEEDPAVIYATRLLWLRLLDGVRRFRWRHWCFAREYILKPWPGTPAARHPTATGGSPIVQWLPNQLRAVVAEMDGAYADVASAAANSRDGEGNGGFGSTQAKAEVDDMMEAARRQADRLEKEVVKFCKERGIEHGQA